MNLVKSHEDAKDMPELKADEIRLLQCYRRLSLSRKELMLGLAENYSAPEPTRPSLRLINGGAV